MRKGIRNRVRRVLVPLLAAGMVLSAGMGSAWAYFTTYAEAAGGYTIELGDRTEVQETFSDWTKRVTVANEEGSQPVWVRARAYSGSTYPLEYATGNFADGAEGPDGEWTDGGDGFYYYSAMLNGAESTRELLVHIGGIPEEPGPEDGFHVVVVYESTPVEYDEAGNPYADWDVVLDAGQTEGGTD